MNIHDELRDHIERETLENIEAGMAPEEARAAALRRFGNVGAEGRVSIALRVLSELRRYPRSE